MPILNDLDKAFEDYKESLETKQNFPKGLLSGILAGFLGAILLGYFTYSTGIHLGEMGALVGIMVALSILYLGKGVNKKFGILGAVLSILGCLLGYYFSAAANSPNPENISYFHLLSSYKVSTFLEELPYMFNLIDLLVFVFAGYFGYKYSFRKRSDLYLEFLR